MKNYKKNDASTKVRILKPILDDWNDCIHDNWIVEANKFDPNGKQVTIRRKAVGLGSHANIHGSLAHEISCICEAYEWVWAIYYDDKQGIYINA